MVKLKHFLMIIGLLASLSVVGQNVIKGKIVDGTTGEPLIGANIFVKGTTDGNVTDYDGIFEVSTSAEYPLVLIASYLGYDELETTVTGDEGKINLKLAENSVTVDVVEVKASRISDEVKKSPLTVEALDAIAIKETPAADFYSGLGALKGVDLTAASLGFKVINTRGFNSTSPVRSLQIIDGIDNQAPGLNFSLGNFLGSSELDVNKVEIIVGASSAFYGPNAFNGVISMETKDPFFHNGLSASVKAGERNLLQSAVRWADTYKNEDGNEWFAYKLNFEHLRANDWIADDYGPVDNSLVDSDNPGGFDAVNIYGDEYQSRNDFSDLPINQTPGLGIWYREGYREEDLVDYDTRNYKANAAFHFRVKPSQAFESPELVIASNYGSGTTVYQGDNRFSLKGITFIQNKIEFAKRDKYFIRGYMTSTTAGDSYDPYFTALELQRRAKSDTEWNKDYVNHWITEVNPEINDNGFPQVELIGFDPNTGLPIFSFDAEEAQMWLDDNRTAIVQYHQDARNVASQGAQGSSGAVPFFRPGTPEFEREFNDITSNFRNEGGTRFFDNSNLIHFHGEYKFTPYWADEITVGANFRRYNPDSRGTIFNDSIVSINNSEVGFYTGIQKSLIANELKFQGAIRTDKNQNFDWVVSPAASLVYTPTEKDFFRVSFSSAVRNPTLSDQYLSLDVGRATLAGNLDGVERLYTTESVREFLNTQNPMALDSFSIDPIRPENVKTIEAGVRTTLFDKLYIDAGYHYSVYNNFIGFKIGVDLETDVIGFVNRIDAFRYSANSNNTVTTQGASIGLNYFFAKKYSFAGNYSWNKLNTELDDEIIPAFNTPEHKFNLGVNGRDLDIDFLNLDNVGFNINYKWVEGFIFEGSPQFTGFVPTYDMVDAQINKRFEGIHTTLKIGASNLLNKMNFQTFGGPRIGRLAYVSLTYDMSN